ncbi:hypothetical protein Hanom_Chr13g01221851 [Helianthus anomalus]
MLTLQSPVTGNPLPCPKPECRPLQPITSLTSLPLIDNSLKKPHPKLGFLEDSNKENPNMNPYPDLIKSEKRHQTCNPNRNRSSISIPTVQIEQFEVFLADELTTISEKMERLKADKEKTKKMLRESELMMEMKMKELHRRGEIQKMFEIEVDRLYRLNELRSLCNVSVNVVVLSEDIAD